MRFSPVGFIAVADGGITIVWIDISHFIIYVNFQIIAHSCIKIWFAKEINRPNKHSDQACVTTKFQTVARVKIYICMLNLFMLLPKNLWKISSPAARESTSSTLYEYAMAVHKINSKVVRLVCNDKLTSIWPKRTTYHRDTSLPDFQ